MRARCAEHGLSVGEDGRCVLCKRSQPAPRQPLLGARGWVLLGCLVVVALGSVLALRLRPETAASAWDDSSSAPDERVTGLVAHPLGSAAEAERRGGEPKTAHYDPARESCALVVPGAGGDDALSGQPQGAIVWISASDRGDVPHAWRPVLQARGMIWVGAHRSGNDREVAHRVALALDALHSASARYPIDPARTFVAGFSGGAKSALRTLLLYPDVFAGALLFAGADYFRDLPASDDPNKHWPSRFREPRDLDVARKRPIALITGDGDFNRVHISDVYGAMLTDSLRARLFSLPALGHALPAAADFDRVLQWATSRVQ